jgi:chromosome segregation ATPase
LNRTSREKEKRVFSMHFNGVSRDAIASELGVSTGAVSEILTLLPQSLRPLRQLSVELRRNGLIIQDILLAVNIQKTLTSLGVTPNQFSTILQEVIKMCETADRKPEDIFQAANKIAELETQAGKPYPAAKEEFEQLNAESHKRKKQNEQLEKLERQQRSQIKWNEEKLAQAYEEANETPQQIRQFKELKAKLSRSGIKISDVDTVKKFLVNIEETGGNPKRVISSIKKISSLKKEIANTKRQKTAAKTEIESLKREKENLEQQLLAKKCLKRDLRLVFIFYLE